MENAKLHCVFHKAPVRIISTQRLPEADPLMFLDLSAGTQISEDLSDCFKCNIDPVKYLINNNLLMLIKKKKQKKNL